VGEVKGAVCGRGEGIYVGEVKGCVGEVKGYVWQR